MTTAWVRDMPPAISRSAAMRVPVLGWVENRLSIDRACSGLTMNMLAVAGLSSATALSIRWAPCSSFFSAPASHNGLRQISPPRRSAAYSRVRDIADCTRMAASGARIMISMVPPMPSGLLRFPPKNRVKFARIEIAPATMAVMVIISVSRFYTWASSCPIAPATSSSDRVRSNPAVAATAAFLGLRPVVLSGLAVALYFAVLLALKASYRTEVVALLPSKNRPDGDTAV